MQLPDPATRAPHHTLAQTEHYARRLAACWTLSPAARDAILGGTRPRLPGLYQQGPASTGALSGRSNGSSPTSQAAPACGRSYSPKPLSIRERTCQNCSIESSVITSHRVSRPRWPPPPKRAHTAGTPWGMGPLRRVGDLPAWPEAGGTFMRILLVASGYNSMTQRVHAELADRGHEVSVELALGDEVLRDGIRRFDPDLVLAPMLTTAIPADIWSARPCFIVHPGPGVTGVRPRWTGRSWAVPGAGVSPCCRRTRRWTPATSGPARSS